MENNKHYTVTIYTKNQIGMLVTICSLFTRRNISIDLLNARPSAKPGASKILIECESTESLIEAVVKQLRKRVDIISVSWSCDEDIIEI